jgi:transcriptional regulator with XRE-family HTH domain
VAELRRDTIGGRINKLRLEAGLTLPELAEASGISKSYLWNLENKPEHQKPSAETLYSIAKVLNTTIAELLGRKLLTEPRLEVDDVLRAFANQENIPEEDVRMLASIQWRGRPPKTIERWRFVYEALKVSRSIDSK